MRQQTLSNDRYTNITAAVMEMLTDTYLRDAR